jgi:hypothetical protein
MANHSYSDKCQVTASASGNTSEAEVLYFDPERRLDVAIGRAIKLSLRYNGQLYEGKSAGMDFESSGPRKLKPIPQGRVR